MARPQKTLTEQEKVFAAYYIEGKEKWTDIARRVFGIRCEPRTLEAGRVQALIRSKAFKEYIAQLNEKKANEVAAEAMLGERGFDWDKLREFAHQNLRNIRDDAKINSNTRFRAIQALEKLADPSTDHNLIFRWLYIVWNYANAHCPSCHTNFPLASIQNQELAKFLQDSKIDYPEPEEDLYKRRLRLLTMADLRIEPHPGQKKALEALERHVIALGAARGGKSRALSMLAILYLMLPGTETWILARVYDDARSEVEYIRGYLETLFHPLTDQLIKEVYDSKTGELTLTTKWNSEFDIRSAKAKGSLTGRELDAIFAAEPGWLSEDIYEEVRARISSRLGRIFAFGTPKGMGGFLGRISNMVGRDYNSEKIIRIKPEQRTLAAGMKWISSLLFYTMDPKDNPAYVRSELEAARMELTDSEYASEFEGKMVADEGSMFYALNQNHARIVAPDDLKGSTIILGIDQGERNFAAVLVAWNYDKVHVIQEYFDSSSNTIKKNLQALRELAPYWITKKEANPGNWILTIFDQDPPVWNILGEMEEEGRKWPTDYTFRHRNQLKKGDNWRAETVEFINQLALDNKIVFDARNADLLHEQLLRVVVVPQSQKSENRTNTKGWIINDPFRGDHVCFHPETDLLTKDGWKNIKDIAAGDTLLTRNPTGGIEYRPAIASFSKDYKGDLLEYNRPLAGASFSVTPDHKLYARRASKRKTNEILFVPAGDLLRGIPAKTIVTPIKSTPAVPGKGLNLKEFDGLAFSYFLGFYLADGCRSISKDRKYVHLDQKNPEILVKITKSLGLKNTPSKSRNLYRVSIRSDYLYDLLGSPALSYEKRIPRWFLDNASVEEHQQLFNGLMDGDGTWSQRKYDTTSEGLADDFQELVARLGNVTRKVVYRRKRKQEKVLGRTCQVKDTFRVRIATNHPYMNLKSKDITKLPYDGKVYCVSVPPYNNVLSRRRGKVMWIGQCDALMLAMWAVMTGAALEVPAKIMDYSPFELQEKALQYQRRIEESVELHGWAPRGSLSNPSDAYQDTFKRQLPIGTLSKYYYSDES